MKMRLRRRHLKDNVKVFIKRTVIFIISALMLWGAIICIKDINNPENDNNNANITANSDDNSCEEIDNDFEEVDLQELEEIKKMLPPLKRRNNKKRTANKRFLNKAKHKHKHKQK